MRRTGRRIRMRRTRRKMRIEEDEVREGRIGLGRAANTSWRGREQAG